jgi:hypothetical protein
MNYGPRTVNVRRGRPKGTTRDPATNILVRLQPGELSLLDQWILTEPDEPSRAEAVKRLMRRSQEWKLMRLRSETYVPITAQSGDEDQDR